MTIAARRQGERTASRESGTRTDRWTTMLVACLAMFPLPAFSAAPNLPAVNVAGLPDDGLSHPPPANGPYAYNGFVPGTSYTDPVFGTTVLRLSSDHDPDDTYARNMWWNADETRYLHRNRNGTPWPDNWDVIEAATGTVTHNAIPIGFSAADAGFDPVDPNILYKYSGSTIRNVTLNADGTWTESVHFTAPAAVQDLGGTLNWLSADGRYMVVRYGAEPSVHVYDRQDMAAGPYANPVDFSELNYVGITPDGKYIVGYRNPPAGFGGMGAGESWALDHGNRSIASTAKEFWSLCGDHGDFVSSSDGRDYMVVANCYDLPQVWAVDITNDAAGLDPPQQRALPNNRLLLQWPTWTDACNHYSTVARGPLKDWVFCSTENGADTFDGGTDDGSGHITPWAAYRQEIMGFNIMTGEIRRLAHHRSRSPWDDYFYSPRLSASWGGKYVSWNSNFNQNGSIDVYAVPFSVTSSNTTPPTIRNVAATPGSQALGGSVTIAADVTDDGQVASVAVNVTIPGGSATNLTMSRGTGSSYTTTRQWTAVGTHAFTVWASDGDGNWAGASGSFLITAPDTSPPAIMHTTPAGTQPVGKPISLAATVVDDVGVVEVRIVFEPPFGLRNESMTFQGGEFVFTLPAQPVPITIRYHIVAVDAAGNWAVSGAYTLSIVRPAVPLLNGLMWLFIVVVLLAGGSLGTYFIRKRKRKAG